MKVFGLIGRPLTHSFSRTYFTEKFHRQNLTDLRYENFELSTIDDLPALLEDHPQLVGLNVTIPYKKEVLPYLNDADPVVKQIGACNCIKITGGRLTGYNTDVIGFRESLVPLLKPFHNKALVLGTGGAAEAVKFVLDELHIEFVSVSRNKKEDGITYDAVDEALLQQHLLLINTTPLGMFPHLDEAPDLPYQYLSNRHLLFDLIYNPEKTLFLAEGEKRGALISNGYQMLVKQAEESWRIWNS